MKSGKLQHLKKVYRLWLPIHFFLLALAPYTLFSGSASLHIFLPPLALNKFFFTALAPNTLFFLVLASYTFCLPALAPYTFFLQALAPYTFFLPALASYKFFYWLQLPLKKPGSPTLNITYIILQINNELDYI